MRMPPLAKRAERCQLTLVDSAVAVRYRTPMRIIAGTLRGRRIEAPQGLATRPMTDRVRENLFNLLGPSACEGARVLDLFCGSGALALEALSRGARAATLVDADPRAVAAARANADRLGVADRVRVERRDALRPASWIVPAGGKAYTLVFVDPPYKITADAVGRRRLADMARRWADLGCVAPGAVTMLRAERGTDAAPAWDGFDLLDTRTYGTTTLYLLRRKNATEP